MSSRRVKRNEEEEEHEMHMHYRDHEPLFPEDVFLGHAIYRGRSSDSEYSVEFYRQKARRGNCCLAFFALILVFLLSVAVGIAVYYLLLTDLGSPHYSAKVSMPILNPAVDPKHQLLSETQIRKHAQSMCQEIKAYFQNGALSRSYRGCDITDASIIANPVKCSCGGLFRGIPEKAYQVELEISFWKYVTGVSIMDIIRNKVTRTSRDGLEVVLIDNNVVDVTGISPPPPITIPPYGIIDAELVQLSFLTVNLTWSVDLMYNFSTEYLKHETAVCENLQSIFYWSYLRQRYHNCSIERFGQHPISVNIDVLFKGPIYPYMQQDITYIIMEKLERVRINDTDYPLLGTLLIEPFDRRRVDITDTTIDLGAPPSTMISPSTPSATIPGGTQILIADISMYIYNTTFNRNPGTAHVDIWNGVGYSFCKEIERLFTQRPIDKGFTTCHVTAVMPPVSGKSYPLMRFYLHFNYPYGFSVEDFVSMIKNDTHELIVNDLDSSGMLKIYLVGNVFVILENIQTNTRWISATSYLPFTSDMAKTSLIQPTPTQDIVTKTSVTSLFPTSQTTSTKHIEYSSVIANMTSGLLDFTFTADLNDKSSPRFQSVQSSYCRELTKFMESSNISHLLKECGIGFFRQTPTYFNFYLTFSGPFGIHIRNNIMWVFENVAPHMTINGIEVAVVGGMKLIWKHIDIDLILRNITLGTSTSMVTPTLSPSMSETAAMTATPSLYPSTTIEIKSNMLNNSLPVDYSNTSSQSFRSQELAFCNDIKYYFTRTAQQSFYLSCYIYNFGINTDPTTIRFGIAFSVPRDGSLENNIYKVLRTEIPQIVINSRAYIVLGGLVLEVGSISIQEGSTSTISQTDIYGSMSSTPVMYSSSLTTETSTVIDERHCYSKPCLNGGICSEALGTFKCTCTKGYIGKQCENDLQECDQNPCINGGTCIEEFGSYKCGCPTGFNGQNCQIDNRHCTSVPCKNGATCTEVTNSYRCTCINGFTGKQCENDVLECNAKPCQNQGICKEVFGSYLCECVQGFQGKHCEHDILECQSKPCRNNGTCQELPGTYKCQCMPGYTGKHCESNVDECLTFPCNTGTCVDTPGSYFCNCTSGFTGQHCEEDIKECSMDPCRNNGTCVEKIGSYFCRCPTGYTGKNCSSDVHECEADPCKNNATCVELIGTFKCECAPGFTGTHCASNINECNSVSPCFNGVCVDTIGSYKCVCNTGFQGKHCDEDIKECETHPCKNNGTCIEKNGFYQCQCESGFLGINCETEGDCVNNPCLNDGTCIQHFSSFQCACKPGITGLYCEKDILECLGSPCQNKGTCIDTLGSYRCVCDTGYTGLHCETDIKECNNAPCMNGGTCTELVGSYFCACVDGITGKDCDEDIKECNNSPCQNGGVCNELFGSYSCSCPLGFKGYNCTEDVEECKTLPCNNGGTCIEETGSYRCACPTGFTGKHCKQDVLECNGTPCQNGGTCIEMYGSYNCACAAGFEGKHCDQDVAECDNSPCQNSGTCKELFGSYSCSCASGYKGQNCELDIEECKTNPCQNGGTCKEQIGSYVCSCPTGYMGQNCGQDVAECDNSPCQNGGTCKELFGSYSCSCASGYKGQNCEQDIEECKTNPCQNGGTCKEQIGSYVCSCPTGYMGQNCGQDVAECDNSPCQNGGTCKELFGSYSCSCASGYKGQNCEQDIQECKNNPCQNGGTCKEQIGSYNCICPTGYTGQNCGQDVAECDNSPCQNGGTCKELFGSYSCSCASGYKGQNCEQDIQECKNDPCQNGGTCKEQIGSYICTCLPGYTGQNCGQDVAECDNNPCQNGGTCKELLGSYSCSCASGYKGYNCDQDILECDTGPCMNFGTCLELSGSYKCVCPTGYSGKHCDETTCKANEFKCDNGNCIPKTQYCDKFADCPDNSDENNCTTVTTCPEGQYQCNDKTCVKNDARCNGNVDCPDGSDELGCGPDECVSFPCQNQGTCINTVGSYYCECPPMFKGTHCDEDVNECDSFPCLNAGVCNNIFGSYICVCTAGWTGFNCSEDVNECDKLPCQNGGTCDNTRGSYYCRCKNGFSGLNCDKDVNECNTQPCLHGGQCVNNVGSFTCTCLKGWTGDVCQTDVNECNTQPCLNGGQCVNNDGSYTCTCLKGWTGDVCQTDVNECNTQPCLNGGQCVNNDGSYTCTCLKGWTGENCQTEIQPCKNGGNCENLDGSYICRCTDQWKGDNCTARVTTTFTYDFVLLNMTLKPDHQNNQSILFKLSELGFCSDVTSRLQGNPDFGSTFDCGINSFRNDPVSMSWRIVLDGRRNEDMKMNISKYLFRFEDQIIYKNYIAVNIGGFIVFVDNFTVTPVMLQMRMLNLTFTPALLNPQSQEFLQLAVHLCQDLNAIMVDLSAIYPSYIQCQVQSFTNNPTSVNINMVFETPRPINVTSDGLFANIWKDRSLIRSGMDLGFMLGGYLIYAKDFTNFTHVPLLFTALNLTWSSDLLDVNSAVYRGHAELFCQDLNMWLRSNVDEFETYEECMILSFGQNPVSVVSALQFTGNLSRMDYKQRILKYLSQSAPQYQYGQSVGYLIGDILVFAAGMDNVLFDATMSEITAFIFNFAYIDDYKNRSSDAFDLIQEKFCGDIDRFFNSSTLRNRYYRCIVENIGDTAPHTITFKMIFTGTDKLGKTETWDIIDNAAPHFIVNKTDMITVGEQLIYTEGNFMANEKISIVGYVTTTAVPRILNTIVDISYELLNFTYTSQMADPDSKPFRDISSPFCEYMNTLYRSRDPIISYSLCEVTRLTQFKLYYRLWFRGEQKQTLKVQVVGILQEHTPFKNVNGKDVMMIAQLSLIKGKESVNQTYVDFDITTPKIPTTTTTPSPSNPCEDVTGMQYFKGQTCRDYVFCLGSTKFEYACPPGQSFDVSSTACVNDPSCQ